jgi:nitrogen PTS system EIIA component
MRHRRCSASAYQVPSLSPLFATFIGFFNERKNQSKTIMALIPAEREHELIEGIEKITGDLDRKEGAMIITTDVSIYRGSMKIMG